MPTKNKKIKQLLGPPKTASYQPLPATQWGFQPRDLPLWNFNIIRAMLWDPTVRLGLHMREAPLHSAEFAYKEGDKWVPGVKADNPEVGEFVLRQLQRIWKNGLAKICKSQTWGWSAGEVLLRVRNGQIEYDRILDRHAMDVRALEQDGRLAAVRFRRVGHIGQQTLDLRFPKAFWSAFNAEGGSHYGHSILKGAYSPWADKWLDGCALDVRRLFMHKDAYGGASMYYPPSTTPIPDGQGGETEIPNQDIAKQIVEQAKAGNVMTLPSVYDANGNRLWEWKDATIPASPTHIFTFCNELDTEILRGLEIPDDVLKSEDSGAWAGKQVPQQAFYNGLDTWLTEIIGGTITPCILEPLIYYRYGCAQDFEVCTKPLGLQSAEQQGEKKAPGNPMPANPFNYGQGERAGNPMQMSLDPVQAVGEGVLDARELVRATKIAMKRRRKTANA